MALNGDRVAAASNRVPQALYDIGIIELLEQDGRPTFILDLQEDTDMDSLQLQPVFCNPSLRSVTHLQDIVTGKAVANSHTSLYEPNKYSDFREWASSLPEHDNLADGYMPNLLYNGLLWSCAPLRKRWRIISASGVSHAPSPDTGEALNPRLAAVAQPSVIPKTVEGLNARERVKANLSLGRMPQQSWTDILPPSEHTDLFKAVDWSQTPLGSLSSWSPHLRQMTCFLMADSRPSSMYW